MRGLIEYLYSVWVTIKKVVPLGLVALGPWCWVGLSFGVHWLIRCVMIWGLIPGLVVVAVAVNPKGRC